MTKPGFISSKIYTQLTKNFKPVKSSSSLPRLPSNKTFSRNTLLLPILLNKTFLVHNGKIFLKVLVSENIVGHKLGEFSQSRRRYYYKKGKKIKPKGKK